MGTSAARRRAKFSGPGARLSPATTRRARPSCPGRAGPHRRHRRRTVGSAAPSTPRGRCPARRRGSVRLARRTRCSSGRSGIEAATPGSTLAGTRRPGRGAGVPTGWGGGSPDRPCCSRRRGLAGSGDPASKGSGELGGRCGRRRRQHPHHQRGPGRDVGEQRTDEVPEPATDRVANDRATHAAGDDEPDPTGPGRRLAADGVDDQKTTANSVATTDDVPELSGETYPLRCREHGAYPSRQSASVEDRARRAPDQARDRR